MPVKIASHALLVVAVVVVVVVSGFSMASASKGQLRENSAAWKNGPIHCQLIAHQEDGSVLEVEFESPLNDTIAILRSGKIISLNETICTEDEVDYFVRIDGRYSSFQDSRKRRMLSVSLGIGSNFSRASLKPAVGIDPAVMSMSFSVLADKDQTSSVGTITCTPKLLMKDF